MKRIVVPVMTMLALLTAPAWAGNIEFRNAVHKDGDESLRTANGERAVLFDKFLKIDWKRLAKAHFTAFPLTNLSKSQVKELDDRSFLGFANITYDAPPTQEYRDAKFVFLSPGGMRALKVSALRGAVRYHLHRDMKNIPTTFFGYVLAVPEPNNPHAGGFVALLRDSQELLSEEIIGVEHPGLAAISPPAKSKPKTQIRYRFSGDPFAYLFVQYEHDAKCEGNCCQYQYFLFREDPKVHRLTPLRSNQYGSCI